MTVYHFQLIYAVWVAWFAYLNKLWIQNQSGFRHWANALSHGSAAAFVSYHWHWLNGAALLFMVRALFDGLLSAFRGVGFAYVSPDPKSLIDQLEKRVFGNNGWLPKLLYFIIAIVLNLIQRHYDH